MTIMTVVRDKSGKLINIGPWDYQEDADTLDKDGKPVQRNPMPDGAVVTTADIVVAPDGARYESTDPRAKGKK